MPNCANANEREAAAPAVLREMVDGYVQIVSLLDPRLAERLDATGRLAVRIGSAMHQSPAELLDIEFAGRLHEIGTLSGEAFLQRIPSLAHLAPIVRSHRERFDGRGYPDGLRGAEIPLASSIVGVAAAFVELVTESPDAPTLLPNDACHELSLAAGTRFDPAVVNAILHVLHFRRQTGRSA